MELNVKTLNNYLNFIYKNIKPDEVKSLCDRIRTLFSQNLNKKPSTELWNEKDFFLITYADSVIQKEKNNLQSLSEFLNKYCKEFSFVHLLPFYPFSSDDGFAVIDYKKIGKANGEWSDFKKLSSKFKIMTDLVINHCSSENQIFTNFLTGKEPGSNFFISSERNFNNFSLVVRPRSSDLSKKVEIMGKKKYVWCTFSHDQIDFNFKNPEVLFFFLEIIKFYLDKGAKALRLDAVAFLWKEKGTKCINLPQTHNIIRLIRHIVESYSKNCLIITETNIPNHENLSYFGNNNEAHCIYNFSLAPLVIHAIVSENNSYLKQWSRSMPPAQFGNAYLNFLSTHDGIGMRPLEGILPKSELNKFIKVLKKSGAFLTHRISQNKKTVYEVNVTLIDAFRETYSGKDNLVLKRFILAHQILFSMEGIPAVYIQNLVGSKNDLKKLEITKSFRSVNRRNWDFDELSKLLKKKSINSKIYLSLIYLVKLRKKQPAFHPNATQFTLQLEKNIFGIWRQSIDRSQSIFCISNLSKQKKKISLLDINLISTEKWYDILSKKRIAEIEGNITLLPYQSMWITNKRL
ncbi:MAG: alpha-amylase family glycosyl hydrolase [Alphaproteobacteria bacterium]